MEPSDKKCLFSGLIGVKEFEKFLSSRGKNRYVPVFSGLQATTNQESQQKAGVARNLAWRKRLIEPGSAVMVGSARGHGSIAKHEAAERSP